MFYPGSRTAAVLALIVAAVPANSQQPSSPSAPASNPSPTGTGTPGNTPGVGTSRGTYGNIPSTRFPTQTPTMPRTYFFSGRVQFDDGTPPNTNVRIERVCGASTRLEAHTDSRGQFSFQLGQGMNVDVDASSSGFPSAGYPRGGGSADGGMFDGGAFPAGRGGMNGDMSSMLWNCELRASYPGYHSDTVRLAGRQPLDPPDVGTIVLHHLGNVQGTTVSLTSALAPKNAQKAFRKGLQLAEKGKMDEAQQKLNEATQIYPKYAVAWYALGQAQLKRGQIGEARKSYQSAIDADSKYVNPYDQLARMAAQAGNWQEAADFSKKAIGLNSVEFPSSLWYNALASYQLKNAKDAERSVRDLLKLDTRHNYPQAENLMGQLLLDQGDYPEAATHLKSYLTLVPNAQNADAVRQMLNKLDTSNALNKPPQ